MTFAPARRVWGSALVPLQPPLRTPLPQLDSSTGLDSGDAEAQAVAPVPRRAPGPARRPAVPRVADPAPAPVHPARGVREIERVGAERRLVVIGFVPVPAPLPDIAVQVVQAKGIRT